MVLGGFFPRSKPVISKDGQTFGIYMWVDILVSCLSDSLISDSLNLIEFRPAKVLKNSAADH